MAAKRLVIVVDGTAAMGPYWSTIVSDYLEKIIRYNTTHSLSLSLSSVLLNCVYSLDIILCCSHNVVLDDI
ncbi:mediator of rna polymerase ii transcription subunit 25 [Quercus suber]|uniref:Mediator of RNA polymerase II transcription subunit 25 n=1 Tax=Quercus suber TaxID=58331 RepID=A0AAW0KNC2_QUESU